MFLVIGRYPPYFYGVVALLFFSGASFNSRQEALGLGVASNACETKIRLLKRKERRQNRRSAKVR
jgi:hypothetical protein